MVGRGEVRVLGLYVDFVYSLICRKVMNGSRLSLKAEILLFLYAAVSSIEMYSEIRLVQWMKWQGVLDFQF